MIIRIADHTYRGKEYKWLTYDREGNVLQRSNDYERIVRRVKEPEIRLHYIGDCNE